MRLAAVPPLITALLYLATGVFVLQHLRSKEKNAFAYSLWLFATVYWQAGWALVFSLSDPRWANLLIRLNYTGIVFIPVAFYQLIVAFLDAKEDLKWLKVSYVVDLVFAVACWIDGWMVD